MHPNNNPTDITVAVPQAGDYDRAIRVALDRNDIPMQEEIIKKIAERCKASQWNRRHGDNK